MPGRARHWLWPHFQTHSVTIGAQTRHRARLAKRYRNGASRRLGGDDGQQTRTKAVQAVFEKNGLTATELDGEARDTELKSFLSADPWYSGAEVDNLSKQEAAIIAARLVRRVQAKVEVSAETAKTLETRLTQAIIKAFNDGFRGQPEREPAFAQELLKVARTNLDENGVAAFQEAFAKGYLPQAEDNEGTKPQAPDCCSSKSTSKS
jgi:hypothetical protein